MGTASTVKSDSAKNPFGGTFENKSNANNNWLFNSNPTTNQQQSSSIFGGGNSAFSGNTTVSNDNKATFSSNAFGGNVFGDGGNSGSAFAANTSVFDKGALMFIFIKLIFNKNLENFGASAFSSPVSGGSAFGSGATFSGGSTFRNRSDVGSLLFGGNNAAPVATSTPIASGFSAFANKSSAFGQLAGSSPQHAPSQGPSMFGGGGGGSAFSSYVF